MSACDDGNECDCGNENQPAPDVNCLYTFGFLMNSRIALGHLHKARAKAPHGTKAIGRHDPFIVPTFNRDLAVAFILIDVPCKLLLVPRWYPPDKCHTRLADAQPTMSLFCYLLRSVRNRYFQPTERKRALDYHI